MKNGKNQHSGRYIAVEGIDGAGKTTIISFIKKYLENKGLDVLLVQEPTDDDIGKLIRRRKKITRDDRNDQLISSLDEITEARIDALLFAADRLQLHYKIVKPSLDSGKIVLSDRSIYSSFAYQTCQGADLKWVEKVNNFALKPHVVVLLDCPVDIALGRLKNSDYREKFENHELLSCVREQYLYLSKKDNNWIIINAEESINDVEKEIASILDNFISPP